MSQPYATTPTAQSIADLARTGPSLPVEDCRGIIRLMTSLFSGAGAESGFDPRALLRLTTKFRDSGRRSPPWRPASSRVPGRPQDGADGNRINRWLLPPDHKFYADEKTATLVEIKYYLQAFSMDQAPRLNPNPIRDAFPWLIDHPVEPATYLDPIQLKHISFTEFASDARTVQSGHLIPLDRGGRHEPANTFLMLARSNQLQGNLTRDELLILMDQIVASHKQNGTFPDPYL